MRGDAREMARLPRHAGEHRAAEPALGVASDERMPMRDPGAEARAHHIGAPGDRVPAVAALEPVGGPAPRRRAAALVERGEIGEPGEAVQTREELRTERCGPRGQGARLHLAGEAEAAGGESLAGGGIAGPRLVDGDGDCRGSGAQEAQVIKRRAIEERARQEHQ